MIWELYLHKDPLCFLSPGFDAFAAFSVMVLMEAAYSFDIGCCRWLVCWFASFRINWMYIFLDLFSCVDI